ncbi:hypothetical protein CC80DRAFT_417770, partial [Byssothecium circinans]
SLSTLLNILDSLALSKGRLLIMITNHIKRLDLALIRPSRVDRKLKLFLVNKDMINQLFYFIYNTPLKSNIYKDELERNFVVKVLKLEFSLAKILSYLLANKHLLYHAITNVAAWIEKLREEKIKLTRIIS